MRHNIFNYILAGLLTSAQAPAALPPTTIKGQLDSTASTTFNLQVPHYQATRLGGPNALIETGNNNMLSDPSFEAATLGSLWSVAGAGFSVATNTSDYFQGKKSLTLTYSASTGNILQSWTLPSGLAGQNFEYSMRIKTALTTLKLCALNAGVQMSCTTIPGTNTWSLVTVNFPTPSSGSQGIAVIASSSTTGTAIIDDAYVGVPRNIGTVSQATEVGSLTYASTTNCNWTSTSTSFAAFAADTDCPTPTVTGAALAPTTKVPGVRFASLAPGKYMFVVSGAFTAAASTPDANHTYELHDGTNAFGQTYNIVRAGSPAVIAHSTGFTASKIYSTALGDTTFQLFSKTSSASNGTYVQNNSTEYAPEGFKITVYRFPTTEETAYQSSQNILPTVQHLTSGTTYTTPTGVSHIKVRMVGGGGGGRGSGTSPGNGGTGGNTTFGSLTANGGSGGDGDAGTGGAASGCTTIVFGSDGAGRPSNAASSYGGKGGDSYFGGGGKGGNNAPAAGAAGKTNSGGGGGGAGNGGTALAGDGGAAGGYCEHVIQNPASSYTYAIGAAGSAGTAGTSGAAGGAGGAGRIIVEEYYQAERVPLLIGSVTSNTSGLERVERARISCASGGSSAVYQSGSWITAVGARSTGSCAITIAAGIFSSSDIACTLTVASSTVQAMGVTIASSTSITVVGPSSDWAGSLICMGPR